MGIHDLLAQVGNAGAILSGDNSGELLNVLHGLEVVLLRNFTLSIDKGPFHIGPGRHLEVRHELVDGEIRILDSGSSHSGDIIVQRGQQGLIPGSLIGDSEGVGLGASVRGVGG